MRLINKTCVITAAAQGIGQATALAFAREGAHVIATDINQELLNELKAQSDNITVENLDVTNKEQIFEFAKKISRRGCIVQLCGLGACRFNFRMRPRAVGPCL